MADNPVTEPTKTGGEPGLPVAAIVCIAIGGYVVVVMILVIIRQCLLNRGMREQFGCCGKEGELSCCECCISCAEGSNCCKSPSIETCLDSICPARKQMDCVDIIMCECCTNTEGGCCGSKEPLCDNWQDKCCPLFYWLYFQGDFYEGCNECCQAQCNDCECNEINCCCFTIGLKGGSPGHAPPPGGYPGYPYPPPPGGYGMPPYAPHGNIPGSHGNLQGHPPPQGYYPGGPSDPFLAGHAHRPLPGGAQPVGQYQNPSHMFAAHSAGPPQHTQPQATAAPF